MGQSTLKEPEYITMPLRAASTLHPPAPPAGFDDYASTVTVLRVCRDPFDDEAPWTLDGFDEGRNLYTEACPRYPSHAQAIAAIPGFLAELRDSGIAIELRAHRQRHAEHERTGASPHA